MPTISVIAPAYENKKKNLALAVELRKAALRSWRKRGRKTQFSLYEKEYIMAMHHSIYEGAYEWTVNRFSKR